MEPYTLDLREDGCPMALLKAKRESVHNNHKELIIQIRDVSSMKDIMAYFDKQGYSTQVESVQQYYVLTINDKRAQLDV